MLVKERGILRCNKPSLILSSPDKWSMFSNFCALAFYHRSTEREKWLMVLSASPSQGRCLLPWWSHCFWKWSGCGSWGSGLGWLRWCWAGGWTSWSWRSLPALVILWNAGNLMQCSKINERACRYWDSTRLCDVTWHTLSTQRWAGAHVVEKDTLLACWDRNCAISPCCHKQNLFLCGVGSGPDVLMWHSGVQVGCISAHFLISAQSF